MQGQNDECYLKKTRVVTYVAGTGHICIWWCGCTDHKFLAGPVGLTACLHLFSLYISVSFPSVAPPPPRSSLLAQWISLAGSVLLSGSRWGWLLMSNWARTWTARADNRKEGILEDSTKATAALFYLSLFPFFPNACDRLEEGWKEGPRPVANIGHLYPDEPPRLCLWVMSVLLMIASLINSV